MIEIITQDSHMIEITANNNYNDTSHYCGIDIYPSLKNYLGEIAECLDIKEAALIQAKQIVNCIMQVYGKDDDIVVYHSLKTKLMESIIGRIKQTIRYAYTPIALTTWRKCRTEANLKANMILNDVIDNTTTKYDDMLVDLASTIVRKRCINATKYQNVKITFTHYSYSKTKKVMSEKAHILAGEMVGRMQDKMACKSTDNSKLQYLVELFGDDPSEPVTPPKLILVKNTLPKIEDVPDDNVAISQYQNKIAEELFNDEAFKLLQERNK